MIMRWFYEILKSVGIKGERVAASRERWSQQEKGNSEKHCPDGRSP